MKKSIKNIMSLLEKKEIHLKDIPDELKDVQEIVNLERKLGLRYKKSCGYDVINNCFYVTDTLCDASMLQPTKYTFDTFEKYYSFLDGNIYDRANYYQFDASKYENLIDVTRIDTKADYEYDEDIIESIVFDEYGTIVYTYSKIWDSLIGRCYIKGIIHRLDRCLNGSELYEYFDQYRKNIISRTIYSSRDDLWRYKHYLFWRYVYDDLKDHDRFLKIMEAVSKTSCDKGLVRELCLVFDPQEVVENYKYRGNSLSMRKTQHAMLEKYAFEVINNKNQIKRKAFYDYHTETFCEVLSLCLDDDERMENKKGKLAAYRYFDTFEDFIKYRNGDLRNCDLSFNTDLFFDKDKYIIDDTTVFPELMDEGIKVVIEKKYHDNSFWIIRKEYSIESGCLLKNNRRNFKTFYDFVVELKGDLSNADLLECDGLINLKDISNYRLDNALLPKNVCDKFGIGYSSDTIIVAEKDSFEITEKNEKKTEVMLKTTGGLFVTDYKSEFIGEEVISYISDLHISHKLLYYDTVLKTDLIKIVREMVFAIVNESQRIILIGGDISSEYGIFKMFVEELRKELEFYNKKKIVIFVLGNHEYWSFSSEDIKTIVNRYSKMLRENGMHLLHNSILFLDENYDYKELSLDEITELSVKKIKTETKNSRIVFFGGTGFSGYNYELNATKGIYKKTIDRKTEIKLTKEFEELYNKVIEACNNRNLIVFTHMPVDCWSKENKIMKNVVYVNGHTHLNYLYDNGEFRIFSDNQIGYYNKKTHMKRFSIMSDYDYFSEYEDGIHEISREDYLIFCSGKNLSATYNREFYKLYMLKRNGYYLFVQKSYDDSCYILNGGRIKKAVSNSVEYLYDNFYNVIQKILLPLNKYTAFQRQISDWVKSIGGRGFIHGCIIDIDFYNHIYVNPIDSSIVPYWASSIIDKIVYPNVISLIQKECPIMYENHLKKIEKQADKNELLRVIGSHSDNEIAIRVTDTSMYSSSNEIRKMQKLKSKVLTTWL